MAGVEALSSSEARKGGAELFWKKLGPSGKLFDVTEGHNWDLTNCGSYLCNAETGYDGPTGWGTPDGVFEAGAPPAVATDAATSITESGATLNGSVNPNGSETKYYFEYGPTESYGKKTSEVSAGSGTSPIEVSKIVTGLTADTTYHYRIVATNAVGTSYGYDQSFRTLPVFNFSFGDSGGSGSGSGQLLLPAGVATDSSGDVWVADTYHNRVQEFNSKGEYVQEFGSEGSGNGDFSHPQGIAVTSVGNVYVADSGNRRVQEFGSKGEFVRAFNGEGSGEGKFYSVAGVAVDGEGHVWAVGSWNKGVEYIPSVVEFSAEGAFIKRFGAEGTENGKFKYPQGIAVDAKGDVWVADTGNGRVQEFKASGEFVRAFGKVGAGNGEFKEPSGIAFDSEGDLWVADKGNDRVQRLTPEGGYISQAGADGNNNGQLEEPQGVAVSGSDVWIADTGNDRVQELTEGKFVLAFGSYGSGEGQLDRPYDVTTDASGNIWVSDTLNYRVEEFNSKDEFVQKFGGPGSGEGQFNSAQGIAVSPSGKVYVADPFSEHVDEFTTKGEFVRSFKGSGTYAPVGVALDSEGHVWTVEEHGRVEEFTAEGVSMTTFGSQGSGEGQLEEPYGIAIDSHKNVWVADTGNNRIEEFKSNGEFVQTIGSQGTGAGQFEKPAGLAFGPEGDLWVTDTGDNRIQRFTPEGGYLGQVGAAGSENGQFSEPKGITVSSSGTVIVADTHNSRIQELTGSEFLVKSGGSWSGAGELERPYDVTTDSSGNVWVSDTLHFRVQEFNPKGEFVREFGGPGSGNGQFNSAQGIAVSSAGNVYVADPFSERVDEFSGQGNFIRSFKGSGTYIPVGIALDSEGHVWTVEEHGRVEEFTPEGVSITTFGSQGSGEGQLQEAYGIAIDSHNNVWIADTGNNRIDEFKPNGTFVRMFGKEGTGNGEFKKPSGLAFGPEGDLWVLDTGNNRLQRLTTEGGYLSQTGKEGSGNGEFSEPKGIATESSGAVIVADTRNSRIQTWTSAHSANDTATAYYSAKEESPITACQNHPEWANLVCRTESPVQPQHGSALPITTVAAYNIWDEAEKTEEQFGTGAKEVKRTKTETYDTAGRAVTSEETASPATGKAMPKVTNEYNSTTGALEKQSTTEGAVTSKYNTLGQLTEYKDASGNVAKYVYEEGSDGRLEEVSEGNGKEAESKATYSYNATTGFMEKLIDTAAGMGSAEGTFTASYDVEGKMTSEVYPNGMCANTAYNSLGDATSLEYIKTRNCSEKEPKVWFSDSIVPSVHGETLQQSSTLSKESYAYDNAGRLTETQETPAGKGCVVRLYGYEEESNRTSLTTREPGGEGKCATTGGTTEHHTYDEANRLSDTGVEYETFGNTTKLPASDAGGHELVSTYYVDNQVASQEQNKQLVDYTYDPLGRTLETTTENTETKAKTTKTFHYAGAGGALTWTSEGTEKWTRNIPGIDGTLCATQEAGKAAALQLHDLEGNVVGTAADNETETKLLTTYNSTEFGVPNEGKTPPKYAWLGAAGISTETSFATGVATQNGASYVPQVARTVQTAPVVPPGAFPMGGEGTSYVATVSSGDLASAEEQATKAWQTTEAERQKAKEEEERRILEQCRAEGGCGAEEGGEESEIGLADPEESGKWGHLHVTLTGEECFPPNEGGGCRGEFSFSGNITEKNGRQSTTVLRVVLEFDGERAQLFSHESHGEYTPDETAKYYIPNHAILYFYLDVWVAGKKDDLIKYSFIVVHGELKI